MSNDTDTAPASRRGKRQKETATMPNDTAPDAVTTSADPAVGSSTPAASLTIQGLVFSAPRLFHAGHVLTSHEADALEQTKNENLRNNFASKVKAAVDLLNKDLPEGSTSTYTSADLDLDTLQAEFAAYASGYAFAARQARTPADPVEAEAVKIAKSQIIAAMKTKQIDPKSISTEQMDNFVKALLVKRPDIREEAQRRIDTTKSIGASILADMGLEG